MRGFYSAVRCRDCGKIYWESDTPYFCSKCGQKLKTEKIIPKGTDIYTQYYSRVVYPIDVEHAEKIVAKKILFRWKVRKDGVDNEQGKVN